MSTIKKILLAEDSSVMSNLTKKVLEFQNYQIVVAKNGQVVLDKLQEDNFDLLLLDINMPVLNGMECCKQIRASGNEKIKNIPIFAITGNAQNFNDADFKEVGINEVLTKPIDYDKLVELVGTYLE